MIERGGVLRNARTMPTDKPKRHSDMSVPKKIVTISNIVSFDGKEAEVDPKNRSFNARRPHSLNTIKRKASNELDDTPDRDNSFDDESPRLEQPRNGRAVGNERRMVESQAEASDIDWESDKNKLPASTL